MLKPLGNNHLEKQRRRWEDNIKVELKVVGWGKNRTDQSHDKDRWCAAVNAVMDIRVP